ncbi:hypothetical protein Q7C36_008494 [Tachysurus vachellii]|uniref:C2H2-type domain-containing protein n=2 Tax=Tachysurus vachellii TaxID=175792 RepID=A0AA88N9C8_TACVA|nr:hypothetical protein Q7C36_008494 [Tachysurus vachellii]
MTGESPSTVTPHSDCGIKEEDTHKCETHSGPPGSEGRETHEHDASLTSDQATHSDRRLCKGGAEKPYTCLTCRKTFATSSHLALHVCTRSGDKKHERSRYRCRKHACAKAFSRPSQLVRHMAVHVGEKPFKCPDCGRCFGRGSHLETHRRLHTGEKPFKCSVCGKSFTQKSGLIVHVRKHTGERPYKCDKCSEAFRTAAHLLSHQAVEAGEGRHACATCHKSFRTVSALRQHEKIHRESHDSFTHTCRVCSGSFVCTSELHNELQDTESVMCVFHCRVCNMVFTDMATFENHCEKHQREKSVCREEDHNLGEEEDEEEVEEEEVGKKKNSVRDPPFRPHVATSATRYTSEVSTRSKTRARSSTEGLN